MRIYVHSKGRASIKTGTLSWLQPLWDKTTIVCPAAQEGLYKIHWPKVRVWCVPDACTLPQVQQLIADACYARKVVMMDDDLRFAYRAGAGTALTNACGTPMLALYRWLSDALNTSAHATISPRQGNNQHDDLLSYVGGARSVLAFRGDVLKRHSVRFDRVPSKSDYDATLQLLRLGYRNAISWRYCHDQIGGPTLPGGCTETRTADIHRLASESLHGLHPSFVKVVVKEKPEWTNTGGKRHDVVVSWKKAYASAVPTNPTPLIRKGTL